MLQDNPSKDIIRTEATIIDFPQNKSKKYKNHPAYKCISSKLNDLEIDVLQKLSLT